MLGNLLYLPFNFEKEGTVIDGECLIYGMKILLLFANSMKKFFDFKK